MVLDFSYKLKAQIASLAICFSASIGSAEPLSDIQQLGQDLFNDTSLSNPPGQSCASCHVAKLAFTGNAGSTIPSVAQGSTADKHGIRNVPTIMYMAFSPAFFIESKKNEKGEMEYTPTGGLFWDGRANSLADQVHGPLLNSNEMNNADAASIATKLRNGANLQLYQKVFGKGASTDAQITLNNIATAIAAFESSTEFAPFSSKFDDFLQGKAQLSTQETAGFEIFKNPEKGNCISCHVGAVDSKNPKDWLFTDFTFDNLGVPRNSDIPANANAATFDEGLCQRDGLQKLLPQGADMASFCGAFKVPTLRNIAITAPYFHNGKFNNLRDAVAFYITRDTQPELWYPKSADGTVQKFNDTKQAAIANVNTSEVPYDRKPGELPRLTDTEIDSIVAFLKTLTDKTLQ